MTRRPGGGNRPWDKDSCLERGKREGKKRRRRPWTEIFEVHCQKMGPTVTEVGYPITGGTARPARYVPFFPGRREKVQVLAYAWEARVRRRKGAPRVGFGGLLLARTLLLSHRQAHTHTSPHIMSASSRGSRAAVPLLRSKYRISQQTNASMSNRRGPKQLTRKCAHLV